MKLVSKNEKHKIPTIFYLLCFLIGMLIEILVGFETIIEYICSLNLIVIFSSFVLSYFATINIHEFGHFVLGKLAGFKLIIYRISVLGWKYENGKFRCFIEKTNGYDGLCMMMPPKEGYTKYRTLLYFAGGIIFNIFSGIILMFIIYFNPMLGQHIKQALWIFAFFSIFIGILNLLPFMSKNNPTDGKVIFGMFKNNKYSKDFLNITQIISCFVKGIRPRNIELLNEKVNRDEEFTVLEVQKLLYMLFNAIDKDDYLRINDCISAIERNSDKIPTVMETPFYYELCFANCILGDSDKAMHYYEKIKLELEKDNDANANRVKAYYEFYINKHNMKSLEYCEKALLMIDKFPIKGQAIMEEDLIKKLKKKINIFD